jgi:hypothetical protein
MVSESTTITYVNIKHSKKTPGQATGLELDLRVIKRESLIKKASKSMSSSSTSDVADVT